MRKKCESRKWEKRRKIEEGEWEWNGKGGGGERPVVGGRQGVPHRILLCPHHSLSHLSVTLPLPLPPPPLHPPRIHLLSPRRRRQRSRRSPRLLPLRRSFRQGRRRRSSRRHHRFLCSLSPHTHTQTLQSTTRTQRPRGYFPGLIEALNPGLVFMLSQRGLGAEISSPHTMSSDSIPETPIVLGCGSVSVDFLATVAAYPKPDDKIRSTSFKVEGGGNAANALTCVARLGLKPRLISKVADDSHGRGIVEELEADGVDTCFMVVSKDGTSPFTYVIVDSQTKSRTCIHTPGFPPMVPADLPESSLLSALSGAGIVFFDGRLHETALVIADEAVRKNIPILMDAERLREGLDDLIKLADYVVCATHFPQVWTGASTVPKALVSMLLRLPDIKFVIVTLGKDGCIMLERSVDEGCSAEEVDADRMLESLEMKRNKNIYTPTCISSSVTKLRAEGIGMVCGRLYVGTAENIPPSELTDTTGAGDAFAGALLYAICANFARDKMLCFAATVAAAKCRALGARSGLPHRTDPRLESFMQ